MSRIVFTKQLDKVPNANLLLLMGEFNAKLGCEAQLWGGAIGRFGLPAPVTDSGTQLLHLCMANNLVVTDTVFQHKPVHLQTWYNPNATDSTKHQIDHILLRRRGIKAVQDTRGADIESDRRLKICKLRLKFRKPAKHTYHPRLQPTPLHSEARKKAFPGGVHSTTSATIHILYAMICR